MAQPDEQADFDTKLETYINSGGKDVLHELFADFLDTDTGKAQVAGMIDTYLESSKGRRKVRAATEDELSSMTVDSSDSDAKPAATPSKSTAATATVASSVSPKMTQLISYESTGKTVSKLKRARSDDETLTRWNVIDDHTGPDIKAESAWSYTKMETVRGKVKRVVVNLTATAFFKVVDEEWGPKARKLVLGSKKATWPSCAEAQYVLGRLLLNLVKRARCNRRHEAGLVVLANIVANYPTEDPRVIEATNSAKDWLKQHQVSE